MDIADIKQRLEALSTGMVAKALQEPIADFTVKANAEPNVCLGWRGKSVIHDYKWFRGVPEQALKDAEAYVAALPTPEQARMKAFLESLGATIELGKKTNIDVEFVNPLVVLMKKLSKNALTHAAQT
ncbi:hypothetical protein [Reyranella sp.]|uniref:hypothetical protein n=1 Tax=Reyranella sp. TaxID=1929291 RepID=UPI00121B77FF|nr:hypothetical protein [Reyranella sp.]TAJ89694.1 MAG: hypothetical protein EPO50_04845 [Reyranella sp.]